MKAVFSVVGLVVVLAIVGVLVKRQGGAFTARQSPAVVAPQSAAGGTGTPRNQVEQVRQAVDQLMQQPRTMPDKE